MQAVTFHFLLSKDNCCHLCLRANILDNLPLTVTAWSKLRFLSGPVPSPSSKPNTNAKSWCASPKPWGSYATGAGCLHKALIHYQISWSESLPPHTQVSTSELWQLNIFDKPVMMPHGSAEKRAPPPKYPTYLTGTLNYTRQTQGWFVCFFLFLLTYYYQGSINLTYTALHHQEFSCGFLHSEELRAAAYRGDRGGKPAQLGKVQEHLVVITHQGLLFDLRRLFLTQ